MGKPRELEIGDFVRVKKKYKWAIGKSENYGCVSGLSRVKGEPRSIDVEFSDGNWNRFDRSCLVFVTPGASYK
jgi:hypothetical protein